MLALVKFSDLKWMLSLEGESIDTYPSLKVLQDSVYAAIESYTGRFLERDTYTEEVQMNGRLLPLRALPIVALTSITHDGAVVDVAGCTRDSFGVSLPYPARGLISAVYTGGLEEAPIEIRRAALLQTLHEWQRRDNIGATNVSTEGGMTTWPELTLLKEVRRMLDPFVHTGRMI
jgi:hypothetical protein